MVRYGNLTVLQMAPSAILDGIAWPARVKPPADQICCMHVWTTDQEYLMVFIAGQIFFWNLCSIFDNIQVLF